MSITRNVCKRVSIPAPPIYFYPMERQFARSRFPAPKGQDREVVTLQKPFARLAGVSLEVEGRSIGVFREDPP